MVRRSQSGAFSSIFDENFDSGHGSESAILSESRETGNSVWRQIFGQLQWWRVE
jgi:hypothetical protein